MKLRSLVAPYLLLVTFYTPLLNNISMKEIRAINQSPYDGVAVPITDAYGTNAPDAEALASSYQAFSKQREKEFLAPGFL